MPAPDKAPHEILGIPLEELAEMREPDAIMPYIIDGKAGKIIEEYGDDAYNNAYVAIIDCLEHDQRVREGRKVGIANRVENYINEHQMNHQAQATAPNSHVVSPPLRRQAMAPRPAMDVTRGQWGSFFNLAKRTIQQIGAAVNMMAGNALILKEKIKLKPDGTWRIPLVRNNNSVASITCVQDKRLIMENLNPKDPDMVDAYVKSIKLMAAGRIPGEKLVIKVDHLPGDVALALANAAKDNGIKTNVSAVEINANKSTLDSGNNYSFGNGKIIEHPRNEPEVSHLPRHR